MRHRQRESPLPRPLGSPGVRGVWSLLLLLTAWTLSPVGLDAAELSLGASQMIDGWLVVPVLLSSPSGASVAALQFDVSYDDGQMAIYDVETGDTAYDADKQTSFTPLENGTARVIVSGLNQSEMAEGVVAVLVMEPYEQGYSTANLQLQHVILSDPHGTRLNEPSPENGGEDAQESAGLPGDDVPGEQAQGSASTSTASADERQTDTGATYAYGGGTGYLPDNPTNAPTMDEGTPHDAGFRKPLPAYGRSTQVDLHGQGARGYPDSHAAAPPRGSASPGQHSAGFRLGADPDSERPGKMPSAEMAAPSVVTSSPTRASQSPAATVIPEQGDGSMPGERGAQALSGMISLVVSMGLVFAARAALFRTPAAKANGAIGRGRTDAFQ